MNNIFVPLEIADLLLEKGFNEPCLAIYLNNKSNNPGYLKEIEFNICRENGIDDPNWEDAISFLTYDSESVYPQYTPAPIIEQVINWFEFKKGIYIYIALDITLSWDYHVGPAYPPIEKLFPNEKWIHSNYTFQTRNQAYLEAITEALKLI